LSSYVIATLIGALAGIHTCTWGMYKDAPHEGFTWGKYFRSMWVGARVLNRSQRSQVAWIKRQRHSYRTPDGGKGRSAYSEPVQSSQVNAIEQ
jgi:hypothetical protein